MNRQEMIDKIKDFTKKPAFPKLLILAGILLMIVILFWDSSDHEGKAASASEVNSDFITSDAYAAELEKKLSEMLSVIEGVGKSKVLVNLTSTEEYVYAEEIKTGSGRTENSYVIVDGGSEKEALVKKLNNPQISGIVIVCEGGDDPRICEKVYKAVATSLDIPTNKIYVTEMK